MRVLYVSHTDAIGGGERSLLELLRVLPSDVSPALATPRGALSEAARELGVPVIEIPGTRASLKLHVRHTPVGLRDLVRSAAVVRSAARRLRADLVHANSTRAGLVTTLLSGPPAVVSVRDALPAGPLTSLAQRVIARRAELVLANSAFTAESFAADTGVRPLVVYPPVDLARFDPRRLERAEARSKLGLGSATPLLGVVAQITPWKGQREAIEVLAGVRRELPDAELVLAGAVTFSGRETRFDNRAYLDSLGAAVTALGLDENVHFVGDRSDVANVLRALDLLLVPSWAEPFGRVVVEGMAMGLPVLATNVGGAAEVITDGVDGLLLPPRRPQEWARTVVELGSDVPRMNALGRAARSTVLERFGTERHGESTLAAYRSVLERGGSARVPASASSATQERP